MAHRQQDFGIDPVQHHDGPVVGVARAARLVDFVDAELIAGGFLQFLGQAHAIAEDQLAVGAVDHRDVVQRFGAGVHLGQQDIEPLHVDFPFVQRADLFQDAEILHAGGNVVHVRHDGHDDEVGGGDGVQRQHAQRRRGVHHDDVVAVLDRLQRPMQPHRRRPQGLVLALLRLG